MKRPAFLSLAAILSLAPLSLAEHFTEGKQVPPTVEKLKAGEFVWEPERAPAGPVLSWSVCPIKSRTFIAMAPASPARA